MTLTNIRFPEDNPFSRIKIRHIFGWFFLLTMAISFQIGIMASTRGINFDSKAQFDPLIGPI
jgi:hypothetical protein